MKEMFNDILARDEQVIKVFKPNKKRYWKSFWIMFSIPIFWPHIIILAALTLFTILFWGPMLYKKGYNNLFYCYTNKRLIVRSGMIGVDYKSLDYKDMTSVDVKVGFLDRKTKTGTITFRTPSAHCRPTVFAYVEQPYEVMKEIQEYVDTHAKK